MIYHHAQNVIKVLHLIAYVPKRGLPLFEVLMMKIIMIQDSLRTNCQMVRAMCAIGQKTLAKKYLNNARKDAECLKRLCNEWELDKTITITNE